MKKIYRGMQNAAEEIDANFKEFEPSTHKITYQTGFKDYNSAQGVSITKVGKAVNISGSCTNDVAVANSATAVIGVLPKECWPKVEKNDLCQASAANIYMLSVKTNGEITMSRHRTGSDYAECKVGSWINVSTMFESI
ncbi:hypothetical protein JZO82_14750 [Vagococcus fluvialis]|jgi:hypothetical protein|uniref:hypothetical protein n=1 Tax=Vagococcus fluvialis TaxID=2738 RepID=UPI001A8D5E70|nr:hypothetical protein [Vagococcus fluvialis]MBO0430424.1 hypothetical protein [Vagococcus fluvialis]